MNDFSPRLQSRMKDGDIEVAVETILLRRFSQDEREGLQIVEPRLWADAYLGASFWNLAEMDVRVQSHHSGPDPEYTLRGIKLRPEGVEAMLAHAKPPRPDRDLNDVFAAAARIAGSPAASTPHLTATSQRSVAGASSDRAPGGRPRKEFWEPLLIAIAAQLYDGTLEPKTQAEVEGAMHQWLSDNERSASEGAVRDRARPLWRLIKDKN